MKTKFDCLCGHTEQVHNFNPDSAFFGCCAKFFDEEVPFSDMVPRGLTLKLCKCDEFRPDTLKYVEEKYAKRNRLR